MTYSTLLYALEADGIAVVTVNRPDKLNALNATVIQELAEVARQVEQDDAVRGVIITGAGAKAFVAGADIAELSTVGEKEGEELSRLGSNAFLAFEQLVKPVIAAVNGFALGGGCELAMACHIRLAAPNAKFGQPEVKLGLIPGYGGTVRLPRLVGRGRALELLLSGNMIDAEEAYRIGLINRVVPAESLLDEARALLRTIGQQSPSAVRAIIETVDMALDMEMDEALSYESKQFGWQCRTEDKQEGTAAFLGKRAAVFPGK
jgi:enoyl-CoA hydratase